MNLKQRSKNCECFESEFIQIYACTKVKKKVEKKKLK